MAQPQHQSQGQHDSHLNHDLPPPPPAHQQQPHQQYQQHRRPSQQQYYQQPSSPQEHPQPAAAYHHQQPSQASSAQAPTQQVEPPPSSHSKSKSRSFSFHSDKAHKRTGSKSDNHHESTADKEARRLHSKADPTLAMNEVEPAMEAAMHHHSELAPLRAIQHNDPYGNPIADPDKSNPTRNRWERPLDTIRSFEAAIDGGYRRKSIQQPNVDPVANWNRRSVFPQVPPQADGPVDNGRYGPTRPGSYYGGQTSRPMSMQYRPDMRGTHTARSSIYGDPRGFHDGGPMDHGTGHGRRRMSRMQTEPAYGPQHGQHGGYRLSHQDRSYETVTSAAEGSGNSDQIGYQTDPTSSDNSSIERRSPAKRREPVNDYGIGFSQPQQYNNLGSGLNNPNQPPPPPPHANLPQQPQQSGRQGIVRKEAPSQLRRQSTQQQTPTAQASPAPQEKRKSWLMRRFSKKD